MKPITIILALAAVAVTGCGTGDDTSAIPEEAFPIVANADLAVGSQRLLVGLVTLDATSHASPDLPVEISLYPPEADEPSITVPGVFIWTAPGIRGLYRAQVEFDRPGIWEVALRTDDGSSTTARIPFNVAEDGVTPSVGEPAPAVATPTGDDVADLSEISTDPNPDPAFYALSLEEALGSGRPTVVVFATPAFCESATCGPMLDTVKQVSSDYPAINFIHIEVYENLDATRREDLKLVEAVMAWNLPSEPWTFIVDRDGNVAARFEGVIDADELVDALERLP
ncbi:MAG: TlpA family protein disulfide reductase [Acidimicrobiia bacterium]